MSQQGDDEPAFNEAPEQMDEEEEVKNEITDEALVGVQQNLIDAIKGTTVSPALVANLRQKYAFIGFSADTSQRIFIARGQADNRNQGQIQGDLKEICVVFVTRGTKINKIMTKTGDQGTLDFAALVNRYKIKRTGIKLKPKTLTLSRIGISFPKVCMLICNALSFTPIGTHDPHVIHKSYCWSGGATYIPKAVGYDGLFENWVLWANSFDVVINKVPDPERVRQFGEIARKNSVINEQAKIQWHNDHPAQPRA